MRGALKTLLTDGPSLVLAAVLVLLALALATGRLRYEGGAVTMTVMATPVPRAAGPSGSWMWDESRKTKLDEPAQPAKAVRSVPMEGGR